MEGLAPLIYSKSAKLSVFFHFFLSFTSLVIMMMAMIMTAIMMTAVTVETTPLLVL